MSHPSDGDRFETPQPEQHSSADQTWAEPGQAQPPYGDDQDPHASEQSATAYGQGSPAYGQEPPAHGQASPEYGEASSLYGQGSPGSSQPSPAYGPASPAGQQIPQDPSRAPAPQSSGNGESGFFRAMVDFRFDHFITVKFSSFLYIVAFLVAALLWLGQILLAILFGVALGSATSFYEEASFNAVPLILAIVFGWIPSVIALIAMRLGLEFSVATVRTAQNTTKLADAATAVR